MHSPKDFSLMSTKWRTNRTSAALITSELQVFVNFVCSCSAFYDVVLKEQKLLDAAASNKNIHGSRKLPLALVFQLSFPTSDSELKNIKEHYFCICIVICTIIDSEKTCSNCLTVFVQLFCFDYL